jgi:transitional endoplasmic reticulum ATPase
MLANLDDETMGALMSALIAKNVARDEIPASAIVTGEEVMFHNQPKIMIPQGWSFAKTHEVLNRVEKDIETVVGHAKTFRYRPYDGAVAAYRVMHRRYGIAFGEAKYTMFGKEPPMTISVPISVGETIEVAWGSVTIPALDRTKFEIGHTMDPEYGLVFQLSAQYPKKLKKQIVSFFEEVEEELRTNSIYRGKAIVGTGNNPEFLDLSGFKREEVVFADTVQETLEGTIWSVLRYTDALRKEGVKIKRAGLLHGPYGCGKSSALQITALEAVDNGWTFIKAGVGQDINEAMKTARLYAPSVLAVEDIDVSASTSEDGKVSRLLETFDGITAKGAEMVVMMTTNHLKRIHKGMLRPGRLDAIVEISELDRNGIERLTRAVVARERLDELVDFDAVHKAMQITLKDPETDKDRVHTFFPAFVREALERAKTVAIGRNHGLGDYVLDTEALVVAANSLHSHLELYLAADEGERKPVVDTVLKELVRKSLDNAPIIDGDGDEMYWMQTAATNGSS